MNCQRDFSDIPIPRGMPDSQRYLNLCLSKHGENILVLTWWKYSRYAAETKNLIYRIYPFLDEKKPEYVPIVAQIKI